MLDGRVSQKRRGDKTKLFKQGRQDDASIPVMLAGVECMAEGHSFHLTNNVILKNASLLALIPVQPSPVRHPAWLVHSNRYPLRAGYEATDPSS